MAHAEQAFATNLLAERILVGDGGVQKHIRDIFAKLDLSPTGQVDRRGAAVLRYLES